MKRGAVELLQLLYGQIPPVVKAGKKNEKANIIHNW